MKRVSIDFLNQYKYVGMLLINVLGRPFRPPHLSNIDEINSSQAAIDNSMPAEFKKCNHAQKISMEFLICTKVY